MELLLQRARQLVDGKKDDGFAALHLAALNGYADVASILLTQVNDLHLDLVTKFQTKCTSASSSTVAVFELFSDLSDVVLRVRQISTLAITVVRLRSCWLCLRAMCLSLNCSSAKVC
jgi:ankyrin repeat protein